MKNICYCEFMVSEYKNNILKFSTTHSVPLRNNFLPADGKHMTEIHKCIYPFCNQWKIIVGISPLILFIAGVAMQGAIFRAA